MKKKLRKFVVILISIIILSEIIYVAGPKPIAPKLDVSHIYLTNDLSLLEKQVNDIEKLTPGIRPGCQAEIVWADTAKRKKTKVAFLYIHGFGASKMEGEPISLMIPKRYAANVYLARLAGHGIDLGDSTFAKVTADDFVYSVEYALAIAEKLGDEVVVMSNSFGGALSCWLASTHPKIKALVLYSPCIKTFNEDMEMFAKPWGLKLASLFNGSSVFSYKPYNDQYAKYWTTHYSLNGLAAFQSFLSNAMNKETFERIKCPVFMGYWYKNENIKDTLASVPAMLKMFDELGSARKQKIAFRNVGNHELTTPILSKDVETVQKETESFLDALLK
jgi:esterase/lipase